MADDLSPILEIYPKSKLLHLCFIRGIRENSCQITCSKNLDIEIHKFWTVFDRKTRPWLIGGLTLSARNLLAVCLLLLQLLQLVLIKSYLVHPPPTYHGAQTKPIKPGTLRYLVFQPCPAHAFIHLSVFVMIIIEKKFLAAFVLIFAGEHSLKLHMWHTAKTSYMFVRGGHHQGCVTFWGVPKDCFFGALSKAKSCYGKICWM